MTSWVLGKKGLKMFTAFAAPPTPEGLLKVLAHCLRLGGLAPEEYNSLFHLITPRVNNPN